MMFSPEQSCAESLDRQDPLAPLRDEFHIPTNADGSDRIYFCGNSLGLQPKQATRYLEEEMTAWQRMGVDGHFESTRPWYSYHELFPESLGRIVGAKSTEVVAMNTLTTNLHLALVSMYRPDETRYKIMTAGRMFPSDRYAVSSHLQARGVTRDDAFVNICARPGERIVREEDIEQALEEHGDSVAVVLIEGVDYSTGQFYDLERLAVAAHAQGAVLGCDLAHAVGNVPLELHDWNVDFAVWCSYKYLNGGPGCIAGFYMHERHGQQTDLPRFGGWWGHDKATRFAMGPDFHPIPGAEGWQLSNPPILPLASLRASLDVFDQTSMQALREKSLRMSSYFLYLLETRLSQTITCLTPEDEGRRGCQLSFTVPGGKAVYTALEEHGVTCDWREPDILRLAAVPLYNSFQDIYRFVTLLEQALTSGVS